MEWEMPYMAQKAMQARRVRRMEMVEREAAEETDDSLPSEEGQDALEDDHGGNDDVEAATSLLSGGKSRYHHHAGAVEGNGRDEKGDDNEREGGDHRRSPCLSLLAASLCPCYLLGRATTLLTEEEGGEEGSEDGNKKVGSNLNREGWWTCLSSCLLASVCPLPCLWPMLACTHRRRQREEIKQRYPHFPSLTPSSTSSFSSSSSSSRSSSSSSGVWSFACESLWPCRLVEEVSFLEEMKRRRRRRRKMEEKKIELRAALPLVEILAGGKAEGKGIGGASAPVDTKWEPFEGWDMRPIAAAAAAAAPAAPAAAAPAAAAPADAISNGRSDGAGSEAEEEGVRKEKEEDDEKSTKHVILTCEMSK